MVAYKTVFSYVKYKLPSMVLVKVMYISYRKYSYREGLVTSYRTGYLYAYVNNAVSVVSKLRS